MRLAVWVVPDVAMVAACVTALYCLFLFQGYQKLFRDSDAGWHIRTGERILATGELPRTDPYSFTRGGQPWFAWEWLSDVGMGAAHRAWGLRGVALLYTAAIGAGVWLWFQLHWKLGGDFLVACAMAPLLLTTCGIHWLARPHVFGWLFLLIAVLLAEKKPAPLAWVAALTALWANVHPSFVLAPLVFAIYAQPRAALVAVAAPLANPYGWRLYGHVYQYLTDSALLSRIGEFQSFDFHAAGAWQIIAALMLGMMGGAWALHERRYSHFALSVLFTALALRSARALPLAALVLLPIANRWKSGYSARLRTIDARFRGWLAAPLAILGMGLLLRGLPAGFPPEDFPVAAYEHIPAGARLFAPDKFGGYLIYRSDGALKVFFDGRSDLYGAEFLRQYGRLVQARPGWYDYYGSFHFSHALLPNDAPLLAALEQRGWQPLYRDKTATLLAAAQNSGVYGVLQKNIGIFSVGQY